MKKYNPENERKKREFFEYQIGSGKCTDVTIDKMRKAIYRFEEYTGFLSFKKFNKDQAMGFKSKLFETKSVVTGKILSKSTILTTLLYVKKFFQWLVLKKGYRRLEKNHTEYFNLTEKEMREARSSNSERAPTLEQILRVLLLMPCDNEIQMRNRALIACAIITGMRDSALASLKLKHVNLERRLIIQDPKDVKTKNSKLIYTNFFPVGQMIEDIFIEYVEYLRKVMLFTDEDPVFPRTKLIQDRNFDLKVDGLSRESWMTANSIRKIFKEAFENAGFEYFNPHSFRKTLVILGEKTCRTPEEFKAWSQNLGHNQVLTTFMSYGNLTPHMQMEIMSRLRCRGIKVPDNLTEEKLEKIKKILLD